METATIRISKGLLEQLKALADKQFRSVPKTIEWLLHVYRTRSKIEAFEAEFGQEARKRYGDDAVDNTNRCLMELSKDEWDAKEQLEESIKSQLKKAIASKNPTSRESQELAKMHEKWIRIHWGNSYNRDNYLSLVRNYTKDMRFVDYYDSVAGKGATEFLIKAVEAYQNL